MPASSRVTCWGSSPRMRGARSPWVDMSAPTRIIPADAGSTVVGIQVWNGKGDHPRGCGEHTKQDAASQTA